MFEYKSGIGIDAHQLESGSQLILGGVLIPHELGLLGHSDGDVLIHSIIDALLGSLTLGDIGSIFPSEDASLRGISSMELLKRVDKLRKESNWQVSHVDATIIAQNPRLSQFLKDMIELTSQTLSINPTLLSIKVTTTDYMGFIGREEGIAACAVAAIEKIS